LEARREDDGYRAIGRGGLFAAGEGIGAATDFHGASLEVGVSTAGGVLEAVAPGLLGETAVRVERAPGEHGERERGQDDRSGKQERDGSAVAPSRISTHLRRSIVGQARMEGAWIQFKSRSS
jgi:hypothetical protein